MKNILRKMGKVRSALMAALLVAGIALGGFGAAVLVKHVNGISSSADDVRVYYAGCTYDGVTYSTNADAWSAAVAYSQANGATFQKTVTEANGVTLDAPNTYTAFEGKKVMFRLDSDWTAQPVKGSITASWVASHKGNGTATSATPNYTAVDTTFFDSANVTTDGTTVTYTPRAGFHPLGSLAVTEGANIVLDLNGHVLDRNLFHVGDCLDAENPQQSINNLIDAGLAGNQTPGNNVLQKNLGQVINVYGHFANDTAYYSNLEVTDSAVDYRDLTVTGNSITHKDGKSVGMIKGGYGGLSSYNYDGGGITVSGLGSLRITGGVIAQNAACGRGGAIMAGMEFNAPKTYDISPKLYIKGGILAQNYSGAGASLNSCSGGIYFLNSQLVEFTNGKIMYNWASGQGGAIYMGEGGNAHITLDVERNADGTPVNPDDEGPEISYNVCAASKLGVSGESTQIGGGICVSWTDRVTLGTCKIINNRAGVEGGGVYIRSKGSSIGYVDVHDNPVVTGNVQGLHGSVTKSNVYLQDEKIFMEVSGKLTNTVVDESGAIAPQIGVYMSNENINSETKQGFFTTGFVTANGSSDQANNYFFCDNESYKVNPAKGVEGQLLQAGSMEYIWNSAIDKSIKTGQNVTVALTADWIATDGKFGAAGVGIDAQGFLKVPAGASITLDLDGHTLSRGLTSGIINGFVIQVAAGTLTVKDTKTTGVITGGYETQGNSGGVCVCNNGTFNLEGGTIKGGSSPQGGTIVVTRDGKGGVSTFNMTGGKITESRSGNAGAIYSEGVVNISGGEICNNSSNGTGGAIVMSNKDAQLTITGGKIYSNYTDLAYGGAIYAGNGATVTISGGQIYGNQAGKGGNGITVDPNDSLGGGVCVKGGKLTVTGGSIYGNVANYGGGVYAANCEVLIDMASGVIGGSALNTTATAATDNVGNHAAIAGGGAAFESCNVIVNKANIAFNYAANYSGGLYAYVCDITINNVNIASNYAVNFSGGAYLTTCETVYNGGTIIGNTVGKHDGGGINVSRGKFTMNGGTIQNNTISDGGGYGAGVMMADGEFIMNGGKINANSSPNRGGGVYMVRSTFVLNDGQISGNKTNSTTGVTYGGGMYVAASKFTMKGGQISGNKTGYGGGIYNDGSIVNIMGGKIGGATLGTGTATEGDYGNYATFGGGIFAVTDICISYDSAIDMQTNIMGGEIIGNSATNSGGGIYISGDQENASDTPDANGISYADFCLNISGGRIAGNKSTQGGAIFGNAYVDELHMTGGQISGNRATSQYGGIYWAGRAVVMDGGKIGGSALNTSGSPSQSDVGNYGSTGAGIVGASNTIMTINGGDICYNTATTESIISGSNITFNGGHVYGNKAGSSIIYSNDKLIMNSVLVENNTATDNIIKWIGVAGNTNYGQGLLLGKGMIIRNNVSGSVCFYVQNVNPWVRGGMILGNKTTSNAKTGLFLTGSLTLQIPNDQTWLSTSTWIELSCESIGVGRAVVRNWRMGYIDSNLVNSDNVFFECYDSKFVCRQNNTTIDIAASNPGTGTKTYMLNWTVKLTNCETVSTNGGYISLPYGSKVSSISTTDDYFGHQVWSIGWGNSYDVGVYDFYMDCWDEYADAYEMGSSYDSPMEFYTNPTLTVEIVPKEIGLSWSTDPVYSGLAQAPTATATGLIGTDQCTVTVEGGYTNAGSEYTCKAVSLSNKNYKLPADVIKVYSVQKAPLTVTVGDREVVYGETIDVSSTTVTVDGLVNNEQQEDVLKGTLSITCAYKAGNNVGNYEITATGWTADNYEITFVPGTLKVLRKGIAVPDVAEGLVYNGEEQTGVSVAEGFASIYKLVNDGYETVSGKGTDAGEYFVYAQLIDDNYCWQDDGQESQLSIIKPCSFTIEKAPLTIVADDLNVTFGENAEGAGYKFFDAEGNEVTAETIGEITGTPEYAFANAEGVEFVAGDTTNGKVGEYVIKISNAADLVAKNYKFVTGEGKLTVAKAELTLNTVSAENSVAGKAYVGLEMSGVALVDDGAATAENKNVAEDNAVPGTLTWKTAEDGTQIKPSGESTFASPTFLQKFVLVFTPEDTTNYSVVEKEVELTVTQLYATVIQKHPAEFSKEDDVKHFKVDYGVEFDFVDADHRIAEGGEATDTNFIVANYEGYDKVYSPARNASVASEGGKLPAMTGTSVEADKIITVSYTEKVVDYKVYHIKQSADGTYPVAAADIESANFASKLASLVASGAIEVENLTMQAGKPAVVTVKEMEGLKQDTASQAGDYAAYKISGTVTGDGKAMFFVFYTRNDYKVMFSLKNGAWAEGFTAPSTVKYGLPIPLTEQPVRTGYTFKGWYTSSAAATSLNEELKWDIANEPMPAKTLWLYAGWQANTYTVSLTVVSETEAVVNAESLVAAGFETTDNETYTKVYTYGTYLALPQISADKVNFKFWHDIDEYGAETQTAVAAINSAFVKDLPNNTPIELMAKWEPKTFTVTLNAAGGTLSGTETGTNTVTATNGQTWGEVLNGVTIEKTGFTFGYWADGEGNVIDSEGIVDVSDDVTLTAVYTAKDYYIVKGENKIAEAGNYKITDSTGATLKLLESTSGATDTASKVHIGDMLTVNIVAPNGYSITGITIGSLEAPVAINNGRSVRITTDSVSEDGFIYINVTVLARTYNVQYDFAGGEATADWNPVRSYKASDEVVELPGFNGNDVTAQVIAKAGYTFEGWYLDNAQEVFTKLEVKQAGISGDLILHASWIAQERTIILDKNSDTLISDFGWKDKISTVYWDEANGCYTTEVISGAESKAITVGMTIKIVQKTPQDYYLLGYASSKNGALEYATTLSEGLPTGEIFFTVKASETENVLYAKWMLAKGNHVLVTRSSNTPSYNPLDGSVVLTGTALGDYGHTEASAKSYIFTWYKVIDIDALKSGNFFDENGELVRDKLFGFDGRDTLIKKIQDNLAAEDKSSNSNSFKLVNVADGGYYICDLEVQIKVNEGDTQTLKAYADLIDIISVEIEPVTITGITFGNRVVSGSEKDIIYNSEDRSNEMSVTLIPNDDFCKSLGKDDNGQFILMADGSKIYVNYYYYQYEGFKREEFNPETDLVNALNAAGGAGVKNAGMYITVAIFTMDAQSNYAKLSPMFAEMEIGQKSIESVTFASEVEGETPFVKAYDGTDLGITASSVDIYEGDDAKIVLEGHDETDYSAEEYVAVVNGLSGENAGNYKLALTQAASTQKYQITRGTRDMSAFEFVYGGEKYVEGTTKVYYDGTQKLIALNVDGTANPLPEGVTVEYAVVYEAFNPSYQLNGANAAKDSDDGVVGAGGTEAGVYKVTASFTDANSANYNDIDDMIINFTVEKASYFSEDPADPHYIDTMLEGFEGGSYPFENGKNRKVYIEKLEADTANFKVTYDVYEKIGAEYQLLATGTKAELKADDTLLLSDSGSEYKVEATVEFVKDADKNNYAEMEIEPITIIIAQGAIDHISVTLKADAQYFYGEEFDKTTIEKITVYYEAKEEGGALQPVDVTEANKIALSAIYEDEGCTVEKEHEKFTRVAGATNAYQLWIKFVENVAPIQMVVNDNPIDGVIVKQKISSVWLEYKKVEGLTETWTKVENGALDYNGANGYDGMLRVAFDTVDETGAAATGYANLDTTAAQTANWAASETAYTLNVINDADGLYVFVDGEGVAYDDSNPMTVDLKINKKTAAVEMFFTDSEGNESAYDDTKLVYCNNLADYVKGAISVKYTLIDGTQKLLNITAESIAAITKAGNHNIKVAFAADDTDSANYKLESEQLEIVVNKKVVKDADATWYYTNDGGKTWTNTDGEKYNMLPFTGNDYVFKVCFTGVDGKTTEVINSAKFNAVNTQTRVEFAEDADANYKIEAFTYVEITKKAVEFKWSDEGKTYSYTGTAIDKPTATISNIEGAENVELTYKLYKGDAVDDTKLTDEILEAGTYLIVVSLDDPTILENYTLSSSKTAKHEIVVEKAGLEATVSIADVTYGEEIKPAVEGTPEDYSGAITYKYATSENGAYTDTVPVNAGEYWVKASFEETAQYGEYETPAVSFNVLQKEITVTVTKNATVVVGNAAPTKFEVTYSGFVGEENETTAGFTGTLTFTVEGYTTSAAVDEFFIVKASGLSATNYKFRYVNGLLTVVAEEKREITLKGDSTLNISNADDGTKCLGKVTESQTLEAVVAQFEGSNLKIRATDINGNELATTDIVGTGTVIELLDDSGNVADKVTVTVLGDLNGDGAVDLFDLVISQQIILGTTNPSNEVKYVSDVNHDGESDLFDLVAIQQHILQLSNLYESEAAVAVQTYSVSSLSIDSSSETYVDTTFAIVAPYIEQVEVDGVDTVETETVATAQTYLVSSSFDELPATTTASFVEQIEADDVGTVESDGEANVNTYFGNPVASFVCKKYADESVYTKGKNINV